MEARGSLSRTQVLAATTLGVSHATVSTLGTFLAKMRQDEVALEIYTPRDRTLVGQVPALITRWVQIRWDAWLEEQWDSTDEVKFPDLAILWRKMRLKESWEPTSLD